VELADQHRLASDVTDLHLMATHLPYDVAPVPHARAVTVALEHRLVLLLPLFSAIDDRVVQLRRLDAWSDEDARLMTDIQLWLREETPDPARPEALRQRCEAVQQAAAYSTWAGMLASNLGMRLVELIDLRASIQILTEHIGTASARTSPAVRSILAERARRPLHHDHGLAFRSALAAVLAMLGCCWFWIMTAWPDGYVAAMIAGVICCFFATLDDPRPGQKGFLIWTLFSFPLTALYLFAILPQVSTFETLIIALSAALLPLGACMGVPAWYGKLMPLTVGFIGSLALNNAYAADFASFANSNLAELIGAGAAVIASGLVRVVGAEAAIMRMVRRSWRDLAALAEDNATSSIPRWTSLAVDRAGLLAPRVARLASDHDLSALDALRGVRRGVNILQLKAAASAVGAAENAALDRVFEQISGYYRGLVRSGPALPSSSLLRSIDDSLAALSVSPSVGVGRPAINSLVGLRRSFFPESFSTVATTYP
jgi:uncharacterized membrane protein YccC